MKNTNQDHPEYKRVISEIENLFYRSFNEICFELINEAMGDEITDYLPSNPFDSETLSDHLSDKEDELYELVDTLRKEKNEEKKVILEQELQELEEYIKSLELAVAEELACYRRWEDEFTLPCVVFEAKQTSFGDVLRKHEKELNKIGFSILEVTDYTNLCLFVHGHRDATIEKNWMPLFVDILKQVTV